MIEDGLIDRMQTNYGKSMHYNKYKAPWTNVYHQSAMNNNTKHSIASQELHLESSTNMERHRD